MRSAVRLMRRSDGVTEMLDDVPLTPIADGMIVVDWVVAAVLVPVMITSAASWPAGMNTGLGEALATFAVPNVSVTYVPPAGDGSESSTCVSRESVAFML